MQSTIFFDQALARLKQKIGVQEDQQVADLLRMKKAAFSARKTRSSFPEKELRALAQERPELGIDVDYVLTGKNKPAQGPSPTQYAARLRMERERLALDVDEFAHAAGLHVDTLLALEAGARPATHAEQNGINQVPGLNVVFLLTGMASGPLPRVLGVDEVELIDIYRNNPPARAVITALLALLPTQKGTP